MNKKNSVLVKTSIPKKVIRNDSKGFELKKNKPPCTKLEASHKDQREKYDRFASELKDKIISVVLEL
jgi:hypothetical protein